VKDGEKRRTINFTGEEGKGARKKGIGHKRMPRVRIFTCGNQELKQQQLRGGG